LREISYIVPVLLGVVDVLLFLVPLLLFILVLRSIRLPEVPSVPIVPFCMVPVPVWVPMLVPLPIVPFCMVPVLVPAPVWVPMVPLGEVVVGVVWAKAAVLTKKAQAAVKSNLVVFMAISN
jgi:hypothetical protein